MKKELKEWEKQQQKRKQDIALSIAEMRPEQWKAVNDAFKALLAFDIDFSECYEICSADVPRDLKRAMAALRYEFDLSYEDA